MQSQARGGNHSVSDAFQHLADSVMDLFTLQLRLWQTQMSADLQKALVPVMGLALMVPFLLMGLLFLNVACVAWLGLWMPLWLSFATVGLANFAVSVGFVALQRHRFSAVPILREPSARLKEGAHVH